MSKKKIILLTQYFEIQNNELRQLELDTCLRINCENPFIDEIVLLNEKIYTKSVMNHPKIKQVDISKRLSYNDVFKYCDQSYDNNDIKILANTDIILDHIDFQYLKQIDLHKKCFALLRHELILPKDRLQQGFNFNEIEKSWISNNKDCKTSQDVWIFTDIKPHDIYDFNLGIRGCDNRIAFLLDRSKINVTNPSNSIKIYHLHSHQKKSHENRERRNYQPFSKWEYKYLLPIKNEEIDNLKLKKK